MAKDFQRGGGKRPRGSGRGGGPPARGGRPFRDGPGQRPKGPVRGRVHIPEKELNKNR